MFVMCSKYDLVDFDTVTMNPKIILQETFRFKIFGSVHR